MSQLSAQITADVSGYRKAIDEARKTLAVFTKEESATAQTMRKVYDVTQDQVKVFKKSLDAMEKATNGSKSNKAAAAALSKELEKLKLQWSNLSDTARKSDFGKQMANSMRQAESQLKGLQSHASGVSTATTTASSAMGNLVGVVGKFAPAITVASAALKTAKDAFFNSEANIDEWGRTVDAAKGTYQVFLDALSNGNWSNFFKNVSKAQKEMRALYDLYDYAGSTNNNNQIAIAQQEKIVAELRRQLSSGKNVKKELAEADKYLRTLKMQGATADKNAGFQGMVTALGADIPENVRRAVVDGLMKGGQNFMDYAAKRVEQLGKVTQYGKTAEYIDANGVRQTRRITENKYAYSGNQALEWEYKALKALVDKESNEELNKGMQSYLKGLNIETQIENASRKIASAVKEGGSSSKSNSPSIVTGSVGYYEDLISKANKELKDAVDNGTVEAIKERINEYQQKIDELLGNAPKYAFKYQFETYKPSKTNEVKTEQYNPDQHLSAIKNEISAVGDLSTAWTGVGEAIQSADPSAILSGIANGINQTINSVTQLAKASEQAAQMQRAASLGTMAASEGEALGKGTASASALPYPANLIAIASVVATIAATFASFSGMMKKPKGFAKGGLVYSPTLALVGEGSRTNNANPEVIAPLDKLKGMLADSGTNGAGGDVYFHISGGNLEGVLKKRNIQNSRR